MEGIADADIVSCRDVCRYVWKGQSTVDGCWRIFREVEVFLTLAALIRTACGSRRVKIVRPNIRVSSCQCCQAYRLKPVGAEQVNETLPDVRRTEDFNEIYA